jgi:hypothetical protein
MSDSKEPDFADGLSPIEAKMIGMQFQIARLMAEIRLHEQFLKKLFPDELRDKDLAQLFAPVIEDALDQTFAEMADHNPDDAARLKMRLQAIRKRRENT